MSEQVSRRNEFITSGLFIRSFNEMDLSQDILKFIRTDLQNPMRDLMNQLDLLPDLNSKKVFILTKYGEDRDTIEYLAGVMVEYRQPNIAQYLRTYNRSAPLIPYVYDLSLIVTPTTVMRGRAGESMRFRMDTNPKGFCLIIVNEPDLLPEAQQLESVFQQMGFQVSPIFVNQTYQQIEQLFDELATDSKYSDYNSLVTIMIGHGKNGLFNVVDPKNPGQCIPIPHLIDKFSGDTGNFGNDTSKPKLHIFNCCRKRNSDELIDTSLVDQTVLQAIEYFKKGWVNDNINTTIIYACAEGTPARYSKTMGFSRFGRALTHTLAQYACEQSINELMRTVNRRLEADGFKQFPETIHFRDRWALYFNPGLPKNNDQSLFSALNTLKQ